VILGFRHDVNEIFAGNFRPDVMFKHSVEDWTDVLSRNVDKYQATLCNIQEELRTDIPVTITNQPAVLQSNRQILYKPAVSVAIYILW